MSFFLNPNPNAGGTGGGGGSDINLSNEIDSTNTSTAATSLAVKRVNDKVDSKADIVHNHNDQYYQKSEVDNNINTVVNNFQNEQYKIKTYSSDQADYLGNKVDNVTLTVEGNELTVKSVDGLTIGVVNLNNWLSGTSGNLQDQIDVLNDLLVSMTSGMNFLGKVETYSDMQAITTQENGSVIVVLSDESRSSGRSMYVYSESLAMWDFIGEFIFSDEFIKLKDTPASYTGADGKYVRVDETNSKLVFDDMDYSALMNKPVSTVTQIDGAVGKAHEHSNKELIDTYTQSDADLANAVLKSHSHPDLEDLNRIGVNSSGQITIDGVPYISPLQKKQHLYARRMDTDQEMSQGGTFIFNHKVSGDISLNTSTGFFTLEQDKTYRVTATFYMGGVSTFARAYIAYADTRSSPTETGSGAILEATNANYSSATSGLLDLVITPNSTRQFLIRLNGLDGADMLFRTGFSSLLIQEL